MKNQTLFQKRCLPCEGYEKPLEIGEILSYLKQIKGWDLVENKKIKKNFQFRNFKEAINFVNKVAKVAEKEKHHPDIYIFYKKVTIELSTHAISGLSENDFIMAAKIDKIKGNEIEK
jgi:4a-hydroxytetrahydrobiopterin dehydratase